jgi:hypothetical protein
MGRQPRVTAVVSPRVQGVQLTNDGWGGGSFCFAHDYHTVPSEHFLHIKEKLSEGSASRITQR